MNCEEYNKCLERLEWACRSLDVEVDSHQLAEIAELIVGPMTGTWRYFHTPQHIFDVGGTDDPIEVLAALFHDLVYIQVDLSVNFNLSYYIAPFSRELEGQLQIRPQEKLPADRFFEMVLSVFGFSPDQVLSPLSGQNEFLSALVAAKVLATFMKPQLLLEIVACIEATIPFQHALENGLTVSDRLFYRLKDANCRFDLNLSEMELRETVKRAVRVANRDVLGFAHPNPAMFLDNTWNLLPETNHNLMHINAYTVREYRVALQKMEGFMNFLTAEVVFRQFDGEPDDRTYHRMVETAGKNIEIAKLYLGSKLFAIAVVEALSLRVGLSIPLSTMMGDHPSQTPKCAQLEDFIPDIQANKPPQNDLEQEVLTLLEQGRTQSAAYDIKHSPLATFMVKSVGFEEICCQRQRAQEFFQGSLSAEDFLAGCNAELTEAIATGVLQLFDSRKSALCRS
ncbi:MAG: hypothetical protein WBB29_13865 [Geitlerinemataceae cyanobacterium]